MKRRSTSDASGYLILSALIVVILDIRVCLSSEVKYTFHDKNQGAFILYVFIHFQVLLTAHYIMIQYQIFMALKSGTNTAILLSHRDLYCPEPRTGIFSVKQPDLKHLGGWPRPSEKSSMTII